MKILNKVEHWIDQINQDHRHQRICCEVFASEFDGFYPIEFLKNSYFVCVDNIPRPDFPELHQMGLGGFINMDIKGITYKNTYYILPHANEELRVHFHELVHVAQWNILGAIPFMQRYINEMLTSGYYGSDLEKMAHALDSHFANQGEKIDIPSYVAEKI